MIGIYKITSPSGRVYIGQSWDIHRRWNKNYAHLFCKKQKKLYNSFIKYGVKNHKFEVLQWFLSNITQKDLDDWELFYINKSINNGESILNLRYGGSGGRLSQETRDKIKRLRIAKFAKIITQFSIEGKLIKVWNSIPEAAEKLGILSNSIHTHLKGITNTCGGFIFKVGTIENDINIIIPQRKRSEKPKKKRIEVRRYYPIYQCDMDGNILKEWMSATYAAEALNLNPRCISWASIGKLKQTGGFIWRKKQDIKNDFQ